MYKPREIYELEKSLRDVDFIVRVLQTELLTNIIKQFYRQLRYPTYVVKGYELVNKNSLAFLFESIIGHAIFRELEQEITEKLKESLEELGWTLHSISTVTDQAYNMEVSVI